MRVSSLMFSNNYLPELNQLEQMQNQLQGEASSGLNTTLPEDNPTVMNQTLNLQAEAATNSQYQNNISQLQSNATEVSSALTALQPLLTAATKIALNSGGATSQAQRNDDAADVSSYLSQALQIANSKDASGNYIFGGTNTNKPPFVATTDASGNITAVTYQGNTSVLSADIGPSMSISGQTPGANSTGTGPEGLFADSRSGADIFSHLISLQKDLSSGSVATISATDVPNLQTDQNHLLGQVSSNGVVLSTLESAGEDATQQATNISTQISNGTSADLATTLSKLSQTQTAYQAALESGVLVMNLSILQYIQ